LKPYNPEIPLISIHIPKCGGTSTRKVLKSWFGNRLYLHYFDKKNGKFPTKHNIKAGLLKRKYKSNICIHGHFNKKRKFGIEDYYPEIRQFITFLRDPFEVHISNYFFIRKRVSQTGILHPIVTKDLTLKEYLIQNKKSFMLHHFPEYLNEENYKEILERYFVYVGIVEDLQHSFDLLSEKLQKQKIRIPVLNQSKRHEQYDSKMQELFRENNTFEMKLYEYVKNNIYNEQ